MPDAKPAQDQIDSALKPEKVKVEEHPISEVDAKKFAGQGDYSLPVSPLDDLVIPTEGDVSKEEAKKVIEPPPPPPTPLPIVPIVPPEPKPLLTPTKIDTAVPKPKVDLEKKAKDLLNGMDTPKKKRGSAATKMALAAVLVVLMGAGGVVGMNLMKLNSENRSQAGGPVGSCPDGTAITGCETRGSSTCKWCGSACAEVCDGTVRCQCDCGWQIGQGVTCNDLCTAACPTTTGGSGEVSVCSCAPPDDGCGTNCKFPGDTQGNVDAAAKASCSPKVAMCVYDGSKWVVSIQDYNSGNKCFGKLSQCNNPYNDGTCTTTTEETPGCVSTTMSGTTLAPGGSITIAATTKTNSKLFVLHFYNPANLSDPNEPRSSKPLMIGGKWFALEFDASSAPTKTHTFTLNYADVYKPDEDWGNKIPTKISFLGHFTDVNGVTNSADPNCWGEIQITPTVVQMSCSNLVKDVAAPVIGSSVVFTCAGVSTDTYEFQYKVGTDAAFTPLAAATTDKTKSVPLSITAAGEYTVQCRACKSGTCTAWGAAN
jgi:hypothetical protein